MCSQTCIQPSRPGALTWPNCAGQSACTLHSLAFFNKVFRCLCRTLEYLQTAQAELVNSTDVNNGLRPFEVRLPSGCIQETDANFKGDLVSGVLNNTMDGDQCCQRCR